MTVEQLQFFLAIEKHLNFSVAADELWVSQSTLSKRIKALESELGVKLFNRTTRKISLTPAGMHFSIHAKRIVREYTKMLHSLKNFSTTQSSINITSIPALNHYGLTDVIASFKKEHPDVKMNICERESQYVINAIEDPETDLVILRTKFIPNGDFKVYSIVDDELVMIVNRKHDLATRKIISLSEAANENFILLSADTCFFNACIEECAKVGFVPNVMHTNIRYETIKRFVSQGLGVSLLMRKVAENIADFNIRVLRLKESPILTLGFVTRNEQLTQICSEFIKYTCDYFSTLDCKRATNEG